MEQRAGTFSLKDRQIFRFSNRDFESAFKSWGFKKNWNALALAHVSGGLMYSSFYLIDYFKLGEMNWPVFWVRVVAFPLLLIMTGSLMALGRLKTQNQLNTLATCTLSSAHAGHFFISMSTPQLGDQYLLVLTMVSLLFTIHLCGIQFRTAFKISGVVLIAFILKELFWGEYIWGEFAFKLMSMVFFVIAGLLSGFMAERTRRQEFMHQHDLEMQRQHLLSKNKELQQFAYIASHDLQEPLRTVASFTDLLAREHQEQLDDHGRQFLSFILKATSRMQRLIKGLLDYSRLGTEKKIVLVDTRREVEEVIADLQVVVEENQVEFVLGKLPVISSYETEFRVIIQNLLNNAIKFSRKDVPNQISVSARKIGSFWQFEIADQGIGIESEHRERIFLIFQRLHNESQYQGTGIGLAHCRKLVELRGGKIWVEANPGGGSIFYFTLPIEIHEN
ncbi:MAG: hypothetical protein H6581_09025 [Bacteroidia bacterium]|nr:hypothetical protein [Bacteroidia bacterium]